MRDKCKKILPRFDIWWVWPAITLTALWPFSLPLHYANQCWLYNWLFSLNCLIHPSLNKYGVTFKIAHCTYLLKELHTKVVTVLHWVLTCDAYDNIWCIYLKLYCYLTPWGYGVSQIPRYHHPPLNWLWSLERRGQS